MKKGGDGKADYKALGKFETYEDKDNSWSLLTKHPGTKNEVVRLVNSVKMCFEVMKRQTTKKDNAWILRRK